MTATALRIHGRNGTARETVKQFRVAAYCRQSVADDLAFGSIEAQRQAIGAFVQSQAASGWCLLSEEYNDSGFSGGNMERPAFQRLLKDIEAGKVDHIACYKIDRWSRSIADFCRTTEFLKQHDVGFTSITQSFSSETSVGRMTLNLLATFAQFERETIAERTRDKIHATRRSGCWTGGRPVLGYDIIASKLVVNADEAERVRAIFQLYLESGSILQVVDELRQRRWTSKTWRNQSGQLVQGRPFNKSSLRALLSNPIYRGMITLGDELHQGVHEALVTQQVWTSVQVQLKLQRRENLLVERNKHGCLLKSILWCGVCQSAMTFHYVKRGAKRYGAYVCARYQKAGAVSCPGSRIAVREIEGHCVAYIKRIGQDEALVAQVVEATHRELETRGPRLESDLHRMELDTRSFAAERKNLVAAVGKGADAVPALVERLKQVDEALAELSQRAAEARQQIAALAEQTIDEGDLRDVLARFDPVFNELFPAEKARLLALLIERVTYDARTSEVSVTFHPGGVRNLAARGKREGR